MTKYLCYSSKPDSFPEEKGEGKISRFQKLGTKSPLILNPHSVSRCWGSAFILPQRGSAKCRESAILSILELRSKLHWAPSTVMLQGLSVQTQKTPFFLFDSLCLSVAPFLEISNLQLSVTYAAASGKERGGPGKVGRAQATGTLLLPHTFQHGVLLISGFRLPPYLICHIQALGRHKMPKLPLILYLRALGNHCPDFFNPSLFWGLGLKSSLTN